MNIKKLHQEYNKYYFLLLAIIICWSFPFSNTFAQGNMTSITSKVPSDITICGAAKLFTIKINNPSPFLLTNVTLTVTMPTGMIYQKASVVGATDSDIISTNKPIFSIANINTLNTVNITFLATANCDIMPYLANGNSPNINVRVAYTANTNIKTYDAHNSLPYLIKQPNLSITTISNQSYSGNVGDTYSRCITIVNGGIGALSEFQFSDKHGSGLKINTISNGTWTSKDTTETVLLSGADFTTIGNKNNLFESGEQITICETVNIINCSSVASSFQATWGCNTQTCQTSTANANIVFPNLVPNLSVTPIASQKTCYGITVPNKQQLSIVNSGKGEAINVKIDIFNSDGVLEHIWQRTSIDANSFTVKYGAALPVAIVVDSTKSNPKLYQFACLPANANRRVYLTIPSIKSGETVLLTWNSYNCCGDNCAPPIHIDVNGWAYQGSYENICKTAYLIPRKQGRYFNRIDGDLTNNNSPAALISGQTGTFNFMFSTYDDWYTAAGSNFWKFTFTIPACLTYVGNFKILAVDGSLAWSPTSVTPSGNTVTAIFKGNKPNQQLAQAQIVADFKANCTACAGGKDTIILKATYTPDATCACEIPVSCNGSSIDIVCPITCEGLNVKTFDVKRSNYGLPDNNDDGLADAGSLNFSKIRTDRTIYGDTVSAILTGIIKTSANNPQWQYAYASNTLTNGNYLSFVDAELKIYRGATIFTCKISNPNIDSSTTTRIYNYDLSAAALIAKACVSPNFSYTDNDSLVFKPRYRVTKNLYGSFVQCFVTENFYTSNIPNPVNKTNKYYCNDFQGNFSIISYYFDNYGPNSYILKECNTITTTQDYYLGLGLCCNGFAGVNYFPFEFRHVAHIQTLSLKVPKGYQFVSAQFHENRTAGTQKVSTSPWIAITPNNVNSDSLAFSVEKFFQGYGGTLPLSDGGHYGTIEVTLAPTCGVVRDTTIAIKQDFIFAPSNNLIGSSTPLLVTRNTYDFLTYQGPELSLQAALPIILANDKEVTYDIILSNITSVNAANVWLAAPQISGIQIVKLIDASTGVAIPITGNIYKLGTLPSNAIRKFKLVATYSSCQQDSIVIHSGWNCNAGYPTSVATYPCTTKQLKLKLVPQIPTLVTNVIGPVDRVSLCDTAAYTIEGVNIQIGTAYTVKLKIILPEGVTIEPGSSQLSYPINTTYTPIVEPTLISGTSYEWNVSSLNTLINNNGLKGILNTDSNTVRIKFKVRTNCNYTSGSTIIFSYTGQSACGLATGEEVTFSSQLGIVGATEPYTTNIKLISSYISPCANNSTMKVVLFNKGPGAFNVTDSFSIQLPTAISYIAGSFKGVYNAPTNPIPTQNSLNNHSNLQWALPSNIAMGDSSIFTFDFKGEQQQLSCGINEFLAKTIIPKKINCILTGASCGIRVITGDTSLPMYIYQAFLALKNIKADAIPNPASGEKVTLDFDITNYGEAILSGNKSVISYYYDANGDSILSKGDTLIAQDSLTVAIPSNGTIKYISSFKVPAGKACGIIAIIDTTINACSCTSTQEYIKNIPLHSAKDTALCADKIKSFTLGYPPITGYTYLWTPTEGLSNTTVSNPLLTLPLIGNADTLKYIVKTTRIGCSTTDTVKIGFGHLPISTAGDPQSVCSGNAVTLTAAGGNTYLWSNGATTPSITVNPSSNTVYTVDVSNGFCSATASVGVTVKKSPIAKFTPSVNEGELPLIVDFLNSSQNSNSYQWFFGDSTASSTANSPSYTYIKSSGDYLVTLIATDSSGQCTSTATTIIKVTSLSSLWIPNTFTPNGDNMNEVFYITGYNITELKASIFNRWGELLYEWNGINGAWDGTYKNKLCPDGTYVYVVEAKGIDDVIYKKSGHITLLR